MNELFAKLPPLLADGEEIELNRHLLEGNDEQKESAKCRLVEANIRLVMKIARSYSYYGVELEDLVNEGNMGLMVAAEKFDPNRGVKFSTYSSFWIKQKILRALTNKSSIIRLPVYLKQRYLGIRKFVDDYKFRNNSSPTNDEIAEEFGISVSSVEKVFAATAPVLRLDAGGRGNGELDGAKFDEYIEDKGSSTPFLILESKDDVEYLAKMLSNLPKREEYILRHRFGLSGEKETLEKIGDKLGVTRERIRQVEGEALVKLRFMYRKKKG
jgi:RNA polymerase sigma factor (sigma-70 family)